MGFNGKHRVAQLHISKALQMKGVVVVVDDELVVVLELVVLKPETTS